MNNKQSLNELKKRTKDLADTLPKENWTIYTRFVELVEEVGELANAIQTTEKFKSSKRQKSDVTNSVCDILFELLLIADHYHIDLDNEYPEVLKEIEERNKSGEFNH